MLRWDEFMDQFTINDFVEMVQDNEQLRVDGQIGDCLMRRVAQAWIDNIGIGGHLIVLHEVGHEAYRRVALHYLADLRREEIWAST